MLNVKSVEPLNVCSSRSCYIKFSDVLKMHGSNEAVNSATLSVHITEVAVSTFQTCEVSKRVTDASH
jgi:hypothetical protein